MMKKLIYLWMLLLILLSSACTVHVPYGWDMDYHEYRVILRVVPDDADVLLDGKFIGEAYEFSEPASALRLHSRNHELVIKKRGYVEEAIDLYDYSTRDITIRVKLLRDKKYYSSPKKPTKKKEEKPKSEYIPKTEPEKKPPAPPKAEEEATVKKVEPVNVTLEISPKESSIYLNGKFWGISPESGKIENLRLEPGQYTLEVVKPGYKEVKKELNIKDKDVKLIIKLEK
jgi:uncharacterized membrane-anchored protein